MSWEPWPRATASGARASEVASTVMATGRSRRWDALSQASRTVRPDSSCNRASWITKIAFSPTIPTIMIAPT